MVVLTTRHCLPLTTSARERAIRVPACRNPLRDNQGGPIGGASRQIFSAALPIEAKSMSRHSAAMAHAAPASDSIGSEADDQGVRTRFIAATQVHAPVVSPALSIVHRSMHFAELLTNSTGARGSGNFFLIKTLLMLCGRGHPAAALVMQDTPSCMISAWPFHTGLRSDWQALLRCASSNSAWASHSSVRQRQWNIWHFSA